MAKKKRQEKEKAKENKIATYQVKIETTVIIALAAFVVGFFGGEIIEFSKSDRPLMEGQQSQMGRQSSQIPSQSSGLTPEQKRSKILDLKKRVASNPSDVQAWNELGHIYLDDHQPQEGIKVFKKILELNPDNAHAWTDLGIMYRQNKQPVEAAAAFDKSIEIEPRNEESRYRKGAVLMQDLHDPEGAIKVWEELLKLNPSAKVGKGRSLREVVEMLKKRHNGRKNP